MALAVFKGYRKGLVVAVFSFFGFFIGLAAALKLSTYVAGRLGEVVTVSERWLPFISFALVFIAVVLLVRLGAKMLEGVAEMAMLGWVNRLLGILLYALIYTMIFSVVLFYADQGKFIKPETIEKSTTFSFIQPIGPKAIDWFGRIIPWFSDMFEDLKGFFGSVGEQKEG